MYCISELAAINLPKKQGAYQKYIYKKYYHIKKKRDKIKCRKWLHVKKNCLHHI